METASFVVTGITRARSVTLGLYGNGNGNGKVSQTLLPAGNVTFPPNQEIPQIGSVVEARYLYAYRESGSIYQPVYLGERDDIPDIDCTTEQLKYKAGPIAACSHPPRIRPWRELLFLARRRPVAGLLILRP